MGYSGGDDAMIINTHLLMAHMVYDNLYNIGMSKVDKYSFLYGNIKPDFTKYLYSKPHRMKQSLNYVLREVSGLIYPKKKNINEFSNSLGVINHFIADFFCSPHYHKPKFNLLTHMLYEFKLHLKIKSMGKKSLSLHDLDIQDLLNRDINHVINCLEDEYINSSPSIEKDIIIALKACTLANHYILTNTLFDFNRELSA